MEIKASYKTSFQCHNGTFALIGGADLTLEYDYGYNYSKVRVTLPIIISHNYIQLSSNCVLISRSLISSRGSNNKYKPSQLRFFLKLILLLTLKRFSLY